MLPKDPLQTAVIIWALTLLSGIAILIVAHNYHDPVAIKNILLNISVSNCIGPIIFTIPFWLLLATVLRFWLDWQTKNTALKTTVILVVASLIALLTGYYSMTDSETTRDMWVFVGLAPIFTFIVLNK